MQPDPDAVERYIAALDTDARAVALEVRRTIHRAAPGVAETVRYKMPCFSVDGEYLVYFGAWKKHIGLYPIPTMDAALERDVAPYRTHTDTVRFDYSKPVPYDLIERLVVALLDRKRD